MRKSNSKMVHGYYSRTDAKAKGAIQALTRKGRHITVTETSADGSKTSKSKDLVYKGLVRRP
jgi:hypothetical protein